MEDLKPYKIGGVYGYFYEKDLENAKLNVDYVSKEFFNIKKLIAGRINLTPLNELVGWKLIKNNFPNEIKKFGTLRKAYSKNPLHLMVLKDDKESLKKLDHFNDALQSIKDRGIYKRILDKYNVSN